MIPVSPCSARLSPEGKVGQLHIHSGFLPIPAKFLPPPISFVPKEMGLGEEGRREGGRKGIVKICKIGRRRACLPRTLGVMRTFSPICE